MISIQRCRGPGNSRTLKNILSVTVGGIRHRGQRRKVIQPVQAGLVCDGVDASQEEVDVVRLPRPQTGSQLTADKVGEC